MSNTVLSQPIQSTDMDIEHKGRGQLSSRLAVDAVTAATATTFVSPIMVIIDRAVVERAAGIATIPKSMIATIKAITQYPLKFLASPPLRAMLMLYSATYLTANICDTLSSARDRLPANTTTSSGTKFCAVTAVNVGLSLYKDASFARTYGLSPSKAFPVISYAPLLLRDGITLFACFNVPAAIAPSMPGQMERYMSRLSVAQLAAPAASQFLTTPLHVLGLDLYERKVSVRERLLRIRKTWISISTTRALRIIPAYGVGGVLNNDVRSYLMEKL